MAEQRYPHNLGGLGIWEGRIGKVNIRWREAAQGRLAAQSKTQGVDETNMKNLVEHLFYECAVDIGCEAVAIIAVPHEFTIDSSEADQGQQADENHISAELSGGTRGRRDIHLYLGSLGVGAAMYDNVTLIGRSVTMKVSGSRVLDAELTWGHTSFKDKGKGSGGSGDKKDEKNQSKREW